MEELIIYHNARCSKSREALTYLEEQELGLEVINYLQEPLSEKELKSLLKGYVGQLKELIRVKDAEKLDVNLPTIFDENEVLTLLLSTPQIMERPIVGKNGKFIVARPLDKVNLIL